MDNLAHALVGAALGRAVADGKAPYPAVVGAIAANAPDWAEFLFGFRARRIDYFTLHRGITHSFLGAAVETVALTLVVGLLALLTRRDKEDQGPRWGWITLCVGLTVASHLFMDWQGSYGLRPFLPWSSRWYYGDWVAIVDPFYWLVPLLALAWGGRRHWRPASGFLFLFAFMLFVLIRNADGVAGWVKLLFPLALVLGGIGWTEHWFGVVGRQRLAAGAVIVLGVYSLVSAAGALPVKAGARRAAAARFGSAASSAALTVVGHPFVWEAVLAGRDTVAGDGWRVPRHLSDPKVQLALTHTAEGRAMAGFARFLTAEVDSGGTSGGTTGSTVYLRDARYARGAPRRGWGVVAVRVE